MAAAAAADTRINEKIRAREVRLVDAEGAQLGIRSLAEALNIAREADLDLVEVAPMANPPVCRIMDYGKFKFDAAQRAKESRRKTTNITIKEMKYRPKIGPGDFETKTRQVAKFLGQGHKVKITIMFRGREMSHQELGLKILNRVAEEVGPVAKVEASPKVDGRNMIMVLAPDKRAQQAAAHASAATNGDGPTPPPEDQPARQHAVPASPAPQAPSRPAPQAPSRPAPQAPSRPAPQAPSSQEGAGRAEDEDRQGSGEALQDHGDGPDPAP